MTSSNSNQVKSLIAVRFFFSIKKTKTCIMAQTNIYWGKVGWCTKQDCTDVVEHELQTDSICDFDKLNDLQLKDF